MFEKDEAKAVFDALATIDEPTAGRDFIYTVTRKSDQSTPSGQVVERTDDELLLLIEGSPNQHVEIAWDDIARIELDARP
jgi:hypothetical protein